MEVWSEKILLKRMIKMNSLIKKMIIIGVPLGLVGIALIPIVSAAMVIWI